MTATITKAPTTICAINTYDLEALALASQELGLSDSEGIRLIESLQALNFTSSVDLTEITENIPSYLLNLLTGKVNNNGSEFVFNDTPQRVIFYTGKIETTMDKPDPRSGFKFGDRQTMGVVLVSTNTDGVRKPGSSALRIITAEYTDAKEYETKSYFSGRVTGLASTVYNRLPGMAYHAAVTVGIPKEDLDKHLTSHKKEQQNSDRKKTAVTIGRQLARSGNFAPVTTLNLPVS